MTIPLEKNPYIPIMATIQSIEVLTAQERLFKVILPEALNHHPGQFVMAGLPGIGECAISISNSPQSSKLLEMVIRKVGNVSGVLHQLKESDEISIRGPFGTGFNLDDFKYQDIVIIAGGLGIVPLRSLILPIMQHKSDYGRVNLIIGSKTPEEALFRKEIQQWNKLPDVSITELVDNTDHQDWNCEVGWVTKPIHKLRLDEEKTQLVLCGPPVMYKCVLHEFKQHFDIPDRQIFIDLERRMRCALGKCGHCQINHLYCCKDGPVFRYSQIKNMPEAFS